MQEFAGAADGLSHAGVAPERPEGVDDITWECIRLVLKWKSKERRAPGVVLGRQGNVELGHGVENGTVGSVERPGRRPQRLKQSGNKR